MTETEGTKRINRTLPELVTGIVLFGAVCQVICFFLPFDKAKIAVGLWLGIFVACVMAWHMWHSINRAVDRGEKGAAGVMLTSFFVRAVLALAMILYLVYTSAGYYLMGALGLLGLKIGAYLQPVVHKIYNFIFHETDPVAEPLLSEEDGKINEEDASGEGE